MEVKSTTKKVGEAILEVLSNEEAPITPKAVKDKISQIHEQNPESKFAFSDWQFYNSVKFLKNKEKIKSTGGRRESKLELVRA